MGSLTHNPVAGSQPSDVHASESVQSAAVLTQIPFTHASLVQRLASSHPASPVQDAASYGPVHRTKLGLSASDYAKLVGVHPITIYSWEQGKTKPRKEQEGAGSNPVAPICFSFPMFLARATTAAIGPACSGVF